MTFHDINIKTIVGNNLKKFIESTGRSQKWISERTSIPKTTYYKLLNGEGDLEKHIEKITELFGIDDPFYFYNKDFQTPKSIEQIRAESDITNLAAANYVAVQGEEMEFKQTLEMLNDFINMIDILKKNTDHDIYKETY